jgi:molecular chaperone GrpE
MNRPDEDTQGPVIRDLRRIDPLTGQVRDVPGQASPGRHAASGQGGGGLDSGPGPDGEGAGPEQAPAAPAGRGADDATARLAERTADLQRLQAEYANYRKRVERDRVAVREQALASVLSELLPVLDDIGRARDHGELTGGFKSVAESLEASAAKLGLTAYGEAGDPFDPTLHDALMHKYSADVTEPTCVQILQPGYKVGDRIVRPARVAVAEPGEDDGGAGDEQAAE